MDNITKYEITLAGMTRLEFARAIKMNYQTLSARMAGYAPWKGDELEKARAILEKGKKKMEVL